jgi:hypothetical protein
MNGPATDAPSAVAPPEGSPAVDTEEIVLRGDEAEVRIPGASPRSLPVKDLVETVHRVGVHGLHGEPLADNVKWCVTRDKLTVLIVEQKPMLRCITWIDPKSEIPFGDEATYRTYRLETPFVVLKVPFLAGRIVPMCELFYRTAPLTGLEDELCWPNLLNVSPEAYGCTAWLCTQKLSKNMETLLARRRLLPTTLTGQLDALVTHLWGGGFNRSSEAHEGQSAFQKAIEDEVDPRVTDVERWQQASTETPGFMLDVKWKPTGLTVGTLIQKQLGAIRRGGRLEKTSDLVSVLMGQIRRKSE